MNLLKKLTDLKVEFEYVFKYSTNNISLFVVSGMNSLKDVEFSNYFYDMLRDVIKDRKITSSNDSMGRAYVKSIPGVSFVTLIDENNYTIEKEREDV